MELATIEDTRALARRLVSTLPYGAMLLLAGPLGAGKTTLTSMIARELGSEAHVSSPSYTLVHEYPTPQGTLVHIDAYRLATARELELLGLDEYLNSSRLLVVEWGEQLIDDYPEAWLVRLERSEGSRSASLLPPTVAGDG